MRRTIASIVTILITATTVHAASPSGGAKAQDQTPIVDEDSADDPDLTEPGLVGVRQGTIVQLERDVAYIDLGENHGLRPGSGLRVLRTISVSHPYTKRQLLDYFPIGQMTVEQVSRVLSYGRIDKRIVGVVKVGDVVRILPPKVAASGPGKNPGAASSPTRPGATLGQPGPAIGSAPSSAESAPDPATAELIRIFKLTLGRPLGERIELLTSYLGAHPDSPYVTALREEISNFRRIEETSARGLKAAKDAGGKAALTVRSADEVRAEKLLNLRRLHILASIPEELDAGEVVELAISMDDPSAVQVAFAYVRRPEANSYDRIKLQPDGDGYFRSRLPATVVRPPSIELFVESVGFDGQSVSAGTALEPLHVKVEHHNEPPPRAPPRSSEIRGFFEYVDFNRFKGNDYYLATEGDFTYRPGTWLSGVSGGFGVLYGRGGKNSDLQQLQDTTLCANVDPNATSSPCGRQAGFNYGYFEVEFRFGKWISMAPRLMVGQTVAGPGAGGELKLRVGQATATNLQFGVSYFSNFGALGSLHLEWNVVKGWPMGASVQVTNQPAQGDIGVRIFYQVAYRSRPWLQPALRVGVAARNIEQIGINLGLGLITAW